MKYYDTPRNVIKTFVYLKKMMNGYRLLNNQIKLVFIYINTKKIEIYFLFHNFLI